MIRFNIDTNSKAAVYRQLVDAVTEAVRKGSLKAGELVPSMNALADELRISKETVKRAYNILSKNGILEAKQEKASMSLTTPQKTVFQYFSLWTSSAYTSRRLSTASTRC